MEGGIASQRPPTKTTAPSPSGVGKRLQQTGRQKVEEGDPLGGNLFLIISIVTFDL